MPRYEQVMPGAYQIIPDPSTDVQAAQERIENFLKKLRENREKRSNGESAS